MIDEALPRFTLSESSNAIKHHSPVYLSRPHSDPEPFYTLQHADPSASNSRNCYAAGLVDAFNADVLYGEVLVQPEWTQPSISQEEIRRNGGVPSPPEPLMPRGFTIQLYNPDQQIQVSQRSTAVLGNVRWEFSMPQDVFRQPSASALDRSQDDPTAELTTVKINFAWKRESNFKRDLTCYMTGRSTDITHKKKSKEPDMAIAHFKGLKDMTIYEPSLYRLEMEDPKGLEVVLILAAAVIKDVYFAKDLGSTFNVSGARAAAPRIRRDSSASAHSQHASPPAQPTRPLPGAGAAAGGLYASAPNKQPRPHASSLPHRDRLDAPDHPSPPGLQQRPTTPRPPLPADPRTAWEIEAETTRLRKAAEAEKRRLQREEERARRERERQAEEESRRLKKMLSREEKEKQRQQREEQERVDRETERLRRMYGVAGGATPGPGTGTGSGDGGPPMMSGATARPTPNSAPLQQRSFAAQQPPRPSHSPAPPSGYAPQPPQQNWTPHQGYAAQFGAGPSHSSSSLAPSGHTSRPNQKPRRSFLNLRGGPEEADRMRKRSSVF